MVPCKSFVKASETSTDCHLDTRYLRAVDRINEWTTSAFIAPGSECRYLFRALERDL
jgi:hypothetical protein